MTREGTEALHRQGSGRRVLVAEDGAMFRTALIRLLGGAGYEVEAFPDGSSALARIAADPGRRFDLLIADVVMPELGGVELVERMRALLDSPPPVVYVSGDVEPALNDPPGTIGGDPILAKPFTSAELFAAIDAALS